MSLVQWTFLFAGSSALLAWYSISTDEVHSSRRLEGAPSSILAEGEPLSLFPLTDRDVVGLFLAASGLLIAAGGGIGGGGFLVPLYILVFGFSPKHAIPLSNITVFGGAIANTMLNVNKRHPLADRPLIDWDIIVLMEPLTVAGAVVGANLNKLLPEVVIVVLLDVLLILTAYKALHDAHHLYELEDHHLHKLDGTPLKEDNRPSETADDAETGALTDSALAQEIRHLNGGDATDSVKQYGSTTLESVPAHIQGDDPKVLLGTILEQERSPATWNVALILAMFFVILIVNVLKGGGSFPSPLGIKCGSISFWLAQLFILTCTVFVSILARVRVLEKTKRREQANYVYLPCDIHWDERSTIIFPLLSALSGLIAGMFGLGGGIVKGPLMLALGVHPAVTSATAACMILFTSFTATSAFVVFGLLVPDYATLLVFVGFFATIVGQLIMNYLLKKFRRNSFIAFSIGIVVAMSAASMSIESVFKVLRDGPHTHCSICSS
jgi:uncharacterized membrane protein YfcA